MDVGSFEVGAFVLQPKINTFAADSFFEADVAGGNP